MRRLILLLIISWSTIVLAHSGVHILSQDWKVYEGPVCQLKDGSVGNLYYEYKSCTLGDCTYMKIRNSTCKPLN